MINLDRLPEEASWRDSATYTPSALAQVEVLSKHKMPFDGVSCERGGKYKCPTCKEHTLALAIDYRCQTLHCNSRVIKYKKYDTEETVTHPLYDTYIDRFYADVERRMDGMEKNKRAIRN